MKIFTRLIVLSFWMISQVSFAQELTPPSESELSPLEEPSTAPAPEEHNLQKGFEDPFGGSSTPATEPAPAVNPSSPESSPILQPPPEEDLPEFKPSEEMPSAAPTEAPSVTPPSETTPPAPEIQQPEPIKSFEFPGPGPSQDAISEEVRDRQQNESATVRGAWSLQTGLGYAFNLNKSRNQVNLDLSGFYRIRPEWDIGLVSYLRFVGPKLLGFVAIAERYWRISEATARRIDWGLGGGLGWTFRAPRSSFNQGQLPLRVQSDLHFYATPSFGLWMGLSMEMFLVRAANNKLNNLVKSGGPPTQGSGSVGLRFVF